MPAPELVPVVLPIRIADRAYLADLTEYDRSVIPALRADSDTAARSGEASVSTQGLWFRWADSFHWGAGQQFFDLTSELDQRTSNRYQYWRSVHLDPWTPHELHLQRRIRSVTYVNGPTVKLHQASNVLYLVDGHQLRWTGDLDAWQLVNGPWGGARINDLNTGVTSVYAATDAGLWRADAGGGTPAGWEFLWPGRITCVLPHGGEVLFGEGPALRLLRPKVDGSGWEANALLTHSDPSFTWTLRSPGPDGWYVGGQALARSELYRFIVNPQDPSQIISSGHVLALPNGERLLFARFYVGVWLLGTSRGVRLGLADADGIQVQPLVPIGPTSDLVADGDSVWASTYGTAAVPMGAVRLEPSRFTETGVPAWAPDIGWDYGIDLPAAAVRTGRMAVSRLNGATVLASAQGFLLGRTYTDVKLGWATYTALLGAVAVYYDLYSLHAMELSRVWAADVGCEPVGFLESGVISFAMPFPKALHDVTVTTEALPEAASVEVQWRRPGEDTWVSLGVSSSLGATEHRFTSDWPAAQAFELRLVLRAGDWIWTYDTLEMGWATYTDLDLGFETYLDVELYGATTLATPCPTVLNWVLRVTPQIEQSLDQVTLNLLFHSNLQGGTDGGQAVAMEVHEEYCRLSDLVRRQAIVEYQEGRGEAVHVKCTGAQLVPSHWAPERGGFGWFEATLRVSLQVLDACETAAASP